MHVDLSLDSSDKKVIDYIYADPDNISSISARVMI